MGCRPSKHATSKIRDAHARTSYSNSIYSPRKYPKKHKGGNGTGAGSRRTSAGTQNGSQGQCSTTGHRRRSHKSDDAEFPAFSTTTAVYRRGASKASKITLRLSSDGSTLEIEQCDYDIAKLKVLERSYPRPWRSAPNLTKVSTKDSPMFRKMDALLRPSSSAWTNAPGSRWTPVPCHAPVSWRKRTESAKTVEGERDSKVHASSVKSVHVENESKVHSSSVNTANNRNDSIHVRGIEKMDIRETVLVDGSPNTEDAPSVEGGRNSNLSDRAQVFSAGHHGNATLGTFSSNTASRASVPNAGGFESHSFKRSSSSNVRSSSQGQIVNPSGMYQFGRESQSFGTSTSSRTQHTEKCTATVRNHPGASRRSGYHYNSEADRFRSSDEVKLRAKNGDKSSGPRNNNNNYQRASIPRYDCFRLRDYNNIHSQSTSSIADHSFQRAGDLPPNQSPGLERLSPSVQRPRSQYDDWSITGKLTDREKLVLNLSARPSLGGVDGVCLTSLVGRRDQHWHSNDNLIGRQNHKQPFFSFLSSPVESDAAVLRFVELGCPVSSSPNHPTKAKVISPPPSYPPAPPLCSVTRTRSVYKGQTEGTWSRHIKTTPSNDCGNSHLASGPGGMDFQTPSGQCARNEIIRILRMNSFSARDDRRCTKVNMTADSDHLAQNDKNKIVADSMMHRRSECLGKLDTANTDQETQTRSVLVQADQCIMEMEHFKTPTVEFKQSIDTIRIDSEHHWMTQGGGHQVREPTGEALDNGRIGSSTRITNTDRVVGQNTSWTLSADKSEAAKENDGCRSMLQGLIKNRPVLEFKEGEEDEQEGGGEEEKFEEKGGNENKMLDFLSNQTDVLRDENNHGDLNCSIRGQTSATSNDAHGPRTTATCNDAYSSRNTTPCNETYGSKRVRTQSLPLLCYNNSFGKQLLSPDRRGNVDDCGRDVIKSDEVDDCTLRESRDRVESHGATSTVSPSLPSAGSEGTGLAPNEMLNPYRANIDPACHPSRSKRGESGGAPPYLIESSRAFHGTVDGNDKIDKAFASGKSPAEGTQGFPGDSHRVVTSDPACCYGRVLDENEPVESRKPCLSGTEGPSVASQTMSDNGALFFSQESRWDTDKIICDLEKSLSKARPGEEAKNTNSSSSYEYICHGMEPESRAPVPLMFLQAAIIGRNVADMADTGSSFVHHSVPSPDHTSAERIAESTGDRLSAVIDRQVDAFMNRDDRAAVNKECIKVETGQGATLSKDKDDAINKNKDGITSIDNKGGVINKSKYFITNKYTSAVIRDRMPANSYFKHQAPVFCTPDICHGKQQTPCHGDLSKPSWKGELRSKYALTNARLASDPNLESALETPQNGRQYGEDSFVTVGHGLFAIISLPQNPASSNPSASGHRALCSSHDNQGSSPFPTPATALPGQSGFVPGQDCTGLPDESTSLQQDMIALHCSGKSSPLTIPVWGASSNEAHALAQLLSSHSSDSLSCSFSSYSLSNTLHSDHAHSDTFNSDTVHSDTPPLPNPSDPPPLQDASLQSDTPSHDTPVHSDTTPKDTPVHSDAPPQDTSIHTDIRQGTSIHSDNSQDTSIYSDNRQDTSIYSDSYPGIKSFHSDFPPQDTSIHSDTHRQHTCNHAGTYLKETFVHYDTAPQDTSMSSDFPHQDTSIHSDSFLQDTSTHYESAYTSASVSAPLRPNDTFQCLDPGPTCCQSFYRQVNDHRTASPACNTQTCIAPSSSLLSSQSHSPSSTPHSSLSPQSSPSSQRTLSHPSTPPSSPSSPLPSEERSVPDITSSPDDGTPHHRREANYYKTLPSLPPPPPSSSSSPPPPPPHPSMAPGRPAPSPPPPHRPHGTRESGLSILAPSTSCGGSLAENPQAEPKQPAIDQAFVLNLDEIQNSPRYWPCHYKGDHSPNWDATSLKDTSRQLRTQAKKFIADNNYFRTQSDVGENSHGHFWTPYEGKHNSQISGCNLTDQGKDVMTSQEDYPEERDNSEIGQDKSGGSTIFICEVKSKSVENESVRGGNNVMFSETESERSANSSMVEETENERGANSRMAIENDSETGANSSTILDNDSERRANSGTILDNENGRGANSSTILDNDSERRANSGTILDNDSERRANSGTILDNENGRGANSSTILDNDIERRANSSTILNNESERGANSGMIVDNENGRGANNLSILDNEREGWAENATILDNEKERGADNATIPDNERERGANSGVRVPLPSHPTIAEYAMGSEYPPIVPDLSPVSPACLESGPGYVIERESGPGHVMEPGSELGFVIGPESELGLVIEPEAGPRLVQKPKSERGLVFQLEPGPVLIRGAEPGQELVSDLEPGTEPVPNLPMKEEDRGNSPKGVGRGETTAQTVVVPGTDSTVPVPDKRSPGGLTKTVEVEGARMNVHSLVQRFESVSWKGQGHGQGLGT